MVFQRPLGDVWASIGATGVVDRMLIGSVRTERGEGTGVVDGNGGRNEGLEERGRCE